MKIQQAGRYNALLVLHCTQDIILLHLCMTTGIARRGGCSGCRCTLTPGQEL